VIVGCLVGQAGYAGSFVGTTLIVAGCVLHWLSKAYLEQNRELTTAGPYRLTRNPFYLANLVVDVGILFVIGELWVSILYLPLWGGAYLETIRAEEERLRDLFGRRFDAYAASVPRFFPSRAPLSSAEANGRFDLMNPSLAEGREYARLLGIAMAPVVIWSAEVLRRLQDEILTGAHRAELAGVLLVPALWILKLALAETSRRPRTRLLPRVGEGVVRPLASMAVSLPLIVALVLSGHDVERVAALLFAMFSLMLSTRSLSDGIRVASEVACGISALAFAWLAGEVWLSIAPILLSALAVLDVIGQRRIEGPQDFAEQNAWPYLPRFAAGVAIAMIAIGYARFWDLSAI
jgi:hypothetical protein